MDLVMKRIYPDPAGNGISTASLVATHFTQSTILTHHQETKNWRYTASWSNGFFFWSGVDKAPADTAAQGGPQNLRNVGFFLALD